MNTDVALKLDYKRTILLGLAFLSINAFWQMYDTAIPLMMKNRFGLGETITGMIMAADNVLALFLLPLFGAWSDKVDTPIGKRMPFILVGTGLAFCFLMMLPYADRTSNLVMFIVALFALLCAMGSYRSPAVALMPDFTAKELRSKGNAVVNLLGALGGGYALVMTRVLVGDGRLPDYQPLFLSLGLLMLGCVAVLFCTIKENKLKEELGLVFVETDAGKTQVLRTKESQTLGKEEKRSIYFILCSVALWFMGFNAITTAFSRYASEIWGLENGAYADSLLVVTLFAVASYIPVGALAGRIGRKRTILLGVVMLCVAYSGVAMYGEYHVSLNICFAMVGFALAAVNVNSLPMLIDICPNEQVGRYTGYYYTFSMAAQVATPVLSGMLLEHVSYRTLFPYALVFTAVAFFTMLMVKHGDSKPVGKGSMLEYFDVED